VSGYAAAAAPVSTMGTVTDLFFGPSAKSKVSQSNKFWWGEYYSQASVT
jgi:hypothetical protein